MACGIISWKTIMFAGKSKKSHLANFTSSVGSVDSYLYQMATIMKRRRAGGWKWFYLKRTNLSENYEQVFILETWLIWYEKPNGNIPEPVVTFPTPPSVTLILRCPEFFPRQRSSFVAHGMIFFLHSLCHGSGSNGHGYTTHRICRPSNTTSCLPSLVASTEKDHRSNEP